MSPREKEPPLEPVDERLGREEKKAVFRQRILADVIERGTKDGTFGRCDAWEVANILWTVANGLIQTELVTTRRELRRRKLDRVFEDTVELFLRGLANPASPG